MSESVHPAGSPDPHLLRNSPAEGLTRDGKTGVYADLQEATRSTGWRRQAAGCRRQAGGGRLEALGNPGIARTPGNRHWHSVGRGVAGGSSASMPLPDPHRDPTPPKKHLPPAASAAWDKKNNPPTKLPEWATSSIKIWGPQPLISPRHRTREPGRHRATVMGPHRGRAN